MNALEFLISDLKLDPVKVMDRLQNEGLVSDECVMPRDVAEIDAARSAMWLRDGEML